LFAKALTAEEATYVADHFTTEIGREQRIVYEVMLIGETLLANYTYAGRIKYGFRGTEREFKQLQEVWYARNPVELRDFEKYPEALQFGASKAGVTYVRLLPVSGISAITGYLGGVGVDVEQAVRAAADRVAPYVEAYKARGSVSR
jgi:hypothetical protein